MPQPQSSNDTELSEQSPLGSSEDPAGTMIQLKDQMRFNQLLQDTVEALVVTQDSAGKILSINRYGRWITGFSEEEICQKPFCSLIEQGDFPQSVRDDLKTLQRGKQQKVEHESRLLRKDGDTITMLWWHTLWQREATGENRIISVALDISDQRLAEDHIGWLATHDPLTGLANRRRFLEDTEQLLDAAKRYNHYFALMLFDLDQFKDVNDISGHMTGDRLLQRVSEVLKSRVRTSDVVARLGGDEFAILVRQANRETALQAAQRFCEALADTGVEHNGRHHQISTSIGIALYPDHGETTEQLFAHADIAMYEAKAKGRNAWHLFDQEEHVIERIQERVYWDEQVKQLLSGERLTVHVQPILNISQKKVSHYEALLRAQDQDGTMLPTPFLINAAERNGMIQKLDESIIESVLHAMQSLNSAGIEAFMSINLSGLSFHNENLVPHIKQCLQTSKVDPSHLIFEITETAAVADIEAAIQVMKSIRALGCKFALDDFGVGFSSLYYLKKLPLDFVKIDGSFIRNLQTNPDHQVLVRALVDVARAYKLETVAEFVEDNQVLSLLQELGVHYAQGYHIDKPKSLADTWGPLP